MCLTVRIGMSGTLPLSVPRTLWPSPTYKRVCLIAANFENDMNNITSLQPVLIEAAFFV